MSLVAGIDEAGRPRHGVCAAMGAGADAADGIKQGSIQDSRPQISLIAGIDEAGRGCWAGAVYAAAVILPVPATIAGLRDSKKLSARQRERLAVEIREKAIAWAVATASAEEIDVLNILRASLEAMTRAANALRPVPEECWVDGLHVPRLQCPAKAIVRGDSLHPAIMAASILAKVARDQDMMMQDTTFPGYGFARHKGYGTNVHRRALEKLGPCAIHRRSFAPVERALLASTARRALESPAMDGIGKGDRT